MMQRAFVILAIAAMGAIFGTLVLSYSERPDLGALAARYVADVPDRLGSPNVITGILITFRGFDTLGEVAVLFMAAAGIGLLLHDDAAPSAPAVDRRRPPSEIVRSGAGVLLPLIFVFGAYVVMNGHISAGGGFQGGAVIASGVMLLLLATPGSNLNVDLLSITESIAGVLYILAGLAGIVLAGGFLDSRILPLGEFGALLSAGSIPLISLLLGIKVGAELSVVVDRFRN